MRKIVLALLFSLLPALALAQNVSTVTITNGVPTAGTGTVSTLDNLIGTAGTSKSNVLSVQGISGGTALPASQSGTWNVNNVSGTVSLPTGASTSANQTTMITNQGTGNTSLATIAANSALPVPDCGATPCTNKLGTVYQQSAYPAGATAVVNAATGTTGTVSAALGGTSGTTYICGFDVSAIGGTAAVGPITVTNLIGSKTFTYQLASSAGGSLLPKIFTPCIPASATSTAITVATTADGTASSVDVNVWGYQQ